MKILSPHTLLAAFLAAPILAGCQAASAPPPKAPFTDYRYEKPGTTRKITPQDLPAPYATKSAANGPNVVARPNNVWPQAPAGFKVELYTTDVQEPRMIITAPNGDFFVAESHSGDIKIFRGITADGKPQQTSVFATGLKQPYGIAFYPPGPEPAICLHRRHRRGAALSVSQWRPEGDGQTATAWRRCHRGGGHWTRDLVFSPDGKQLFVGVGSTSPTSTTLTLIPRRRTAPTSWR